MIRDRGRIKWTSMMLPEHVKMLRDWAKEDSWEAKQELDEQKLEYMDEVVDEALRLDKSVIVRYYRNHHFEEVTGAIHSFDPLGKTIKILMKEGDVLSIQLNEIDNIEFA